MFTIAKVFIALMAATTVVAAPNKRPSFHDVTCTFLMAPDAPVGSIDLDTEFNFVIGGTLSLQVIGIAVDGANISIANNGNNTFTVVRSDGVDGKTAAQTAAILTGLVGVTTSGFANDAEFNWTFESVTCNA